MSKRTKTTLKIGLSWAVLGAFIWTIVLGVLFNFFDFLSANFTGQVDAYNQAVHAELPETAYEAYRQ